jgi:anti-anti-sigma factor
MVAAPPIATRRAGAGVAVVVLRGELDAYNAPAMKRELASALEAGNDLVVDLRAASFIDSVIGGELLEAREDAKQRGAGLALVLSDSRANHVRRMLEQTNLIAIFDVFDTPEEAVVGLRTGGRP